MPIQKVPVRNGPIAWPPRWLRAAFWRTAHPNNFILDTALPWVLSDTPAKCEVDRMNSCRENRRTDRHTYSTYSTYIHTYIHTVHTYIHTYIHTNMYTETLSICSLTSIKTMMSRPFIYKMPHGSRLVEYNRHWQTEKEPLVKPSPMLSSHTKVGGWDELWPGPSRGGRSPADANSYGANSRSEVRACHNDAAGERAANECCHAGRVRYYGMSVCVHLQNKNLKKGRRV